MTHSSPSSRRAAGATATRGHSDDEGGRVRKTVTRATALRPRTRGIDSKTTRRVASKPTATVGYHAFEDPTEAFIAHITTSDGDAAGGTTLPNAQHGSVAAPGDKPWLPPNAYPVIPPPSPVPVRPSVRDSLAARAVERRHSLSDSLLSAASAAEGATSTSRRPSVSRSPMGSRSPSQSRSPRGSSGGGHRRRRHNTAASPSPARDASADSQSRDLGGIAFRRHGQVASGKAAGLVEGVSTPVRRRSGNDSSSLALGTDVDDVESIIHEYMGLVQPGSAARHGDGGGDDLDSDRDVGRSSTRRTSSRRTRGRDVESLSSVRSRGSGRSSSNSSAGLRANLSELERELGLSPSGGAGVGALQQRGSGNSGRQRRPASSSSTAKAAKAAKAGPVGARRTGTRTAASTRRVGSGSGRDSEASPASQYTESYDSIPERHLIAVDMSGEAGMDGLPAAVTGRHTSSHDHGGSGGGGRGGGTPSAGPSRVVLIGMPSSARGNGVDDGSGSFAADSTPRASRARDGGSHGGAGGGSGGSATRRGRVSVEQPVPQWVPVLSNAAVKQMKRVTPSGGGTPKDLLL